MLTIMLTTIAATIPTDWVPCGTLARATGWPGQPERFRFYRLPDGAIGEVISHPMNDDFLICITDVATARQRWVELLEGEPCNEPGYRGTTFPKAYRES